MRQVDVDRESSYPVTLMLNGDGGTTDIGELLDLGETFFFHLTKSAAGFDALTVDQVIKLHDHGVD